MNKKVVAIFLFICYPFLTFANLDSLLQVYNSTNQETVRLETANKIAAEYEYKSADSTLYFAEIALEIAQSLKNKNKELLAYYNLGLAYYQFKSYD